MRTKQLQDSKVKRMLLYWDYLGKMRIDPDASVEFISYMFSVSEAWISRIIKTRDLSEPELMKIELEHIEIEYKLIDSYAQKLLRKAKKQRPISNKNQQQNMFE